MCLFAVNMLDAGFKDSILATVLLEQASSNHTLQSGLPAPCCHHIQERLLSYGQTPHLQACPAQYIASEKHPLQQRVSLSGDIIGPKGFSSVPELIKLLTTAVTAVAPGAAIKPLREDANSSSNVGKLVVTVQVHTRPPLFLLDLASPPFPLLQPTATAFPSHIHSHAHRSSQSPLFTFSQVPMHWDPLILDPITVVAPNNPDVSYTFFVKGLPTFQHIGALVILKPDIIQIDNLEQVKSPLALSSPPAQSQRLQHFLVPKLSMYLQTNPSADLPCLLSQVPHIQPSPFALSISFTLPFSSLQVVEALERAQRRYKLEERPTALEKTAMKVVTARNAPFCYYLSADQALTVSIACRPGLIIGTETCKTRLAFVYNTVQVSRGITATQKKSGLLREWLAATHIVHAEQHNPRKRAAEPVISEVEEVAKHNPDGMQVQFPCTIVARALAPPVLMPLSIALPLESRRSFSSCFRPAPLKPSINVLAMHSPQIGSHFSRNLSIVFADQLTEASLWQGHQHFPLRARLFVGPATFQHCKM
jgi:hypothetical protein